MNNCGETTTEEGHKVFYSGEKDKHEHGTGFYTVMGCCPVSSRLITIRLRAVLSIITIAHAYAPTSGYNDNEIEYLYDRLQNVIDQTPKNYILVGKQKWARMPVETGKAFVDPSAMMTQMRED